MQYPVAGAVSSTQTGLLTPNHLLNQRYRILEQLGKGGFGAVYKAEDIQFGNRLVAVKEMRQSGLSPEEMKEAAKAFEHEALMLAGLRHQHLPRIYDHFHDGGRWYLVMDFIEGETLEGHLNKAKGGHLSVEEALRIGIQLCTVLNYLHTRQPPIIFRDLKPDNIMLTPDGHVYLIDFGIARHFKPGQAKDTTAFGSPGYAAPEQYGKAQTTPRSDIYSLGATLHRLLSGNDPSANKPTIFDFPLLQLHAQPTPPELQTLNMRMVDKNESRRPANMADVKQELQQIASQLARRTLLPPTQLVGGTPLPPIQRAMGRSRIFGIIAGIVAVILVVAFISSTLSAHSGQSSSQTTLNNSSTTSAPVPTAAPSPIPTVAPTPTPTPIPPTPTPKPVVKIYPNETWQGRLISCNNYQNVSDGSCPVRLIITSVNGSHFDGKWEAEFVPGEGFENNIEYITGVLDKDLLIFQGTGISTGIIVSDGKYQAALLPNGNLHNPSLFGDSDMVHTR
jgi:serine/threonine protein kinase